ncbi:hypothetical protein [Nocardioides perillae]|uniref:Putative SnoaL-like aldol condensation-catalyzing enzyme n=1 Tax=Nocardioides perillae TaxID=1119534 RepID=A0A7Y9RUP8_9ACTN|nr:hypothetical protein [Nocardioides perillae]NYG54953.1 putative SnoaL-like aldol condensation-catalyzing enzyme [Nocardioides perillae]
MTDDKKVHVGKVVKQGGEVATGASGINALHNLVQAAKEVFVVHEEESTKRKRLDAYEATEVARIRAAESALKDYFAQVFAERRHVIDESFERLDRAMEDGDAATVHQVVRGIVDIAQSSPLADLGDLGEIRKALDDPDQVWEL